MSERGTGLERAVGALEVVFARLPVDRKRAFALAVYRVWPSIRQYTDDVDGLMSPEFTEASWRIMLAMIFVLPRGKEHAIEKLAAAFKARAPGILRFARTVAAACEGGPPPLPLPENHAQVEAAEELPEPPP